MVLVRAVVTEMAPVLRSRSARAWAGWKGAPVHQVSESAAFVSTLN